MIIGKQPEVLVRCVKMESSSAVNESQMMQLFGKIQSCQFLGMLTWLTISPSNCLNIHPGELEYECS